MILKSYFEKMIPVTTDALSHESDYRQSFPPLGIVSKWRPPPSNILYSFSLVLALLINGVNGTTCFGMLFLQKTHFGGIYFRGHIAIPPKTPLRAQDFSILWWTAEDNRKRKSPDFSGLSDDIAWYRIMRWCRRSESNRHECPTCNISKLQPYSFERFLFRATLYYYFVHVKVYQFNVSAN